MPLTTRPTCQLMTMPDSSVPTAHRKSTQFSDFTLEVRLHPHLQPQHQHQLAEEQENGEQEQEVGPWVRNLRWDMREVW